MTKGYVIYWRDTKTGDIGKTPAYYTRAEADNAARLLKERNANMETKVQRRGGQDRKRLHGYW